MADKEMTETQPDLAVYDEFHRGGATLWSSGLRRLLDMYPEVPVLGCSAADIRYLDNQRNIANELFDSNIAREMKLGEAIIRGILAAPKYVHVGLCLWSNSCKNDWDDCFAHVRRTYYLDRRRQELWLV